MKRSDMLNKNIHQTNNLSQKSPGSPEYPIHDSGQTDRARHFSLIIFFSVITLLGACSEKLNLVVLDGSYKGFFYYIPAGGTQITKSAEEVSVILNGKEYTSTGSTGRIPAGGTGKYSVLSNNIVQFQDERVWTADFDWNMILNGNYRYEVKNDSLILTRNFELCSSCNTTNGLYQYRLKRIN
ncbi:hypothetical protein [Daejeonella sp. H1SJ63]|uniref:hypothetical protein n=1 Tax=Daejeonella sp. H1SJ63 TaxID=3034145 RepID=UPI0023ECFFAD|nr:hypothetical protein [Daejeonella sp. H1SJ63]